MYSATGWVIYTIELCSDSKREHAHSLTHTHSMPLSLSQHTHKFNSNQRKFPLTPFIALLFSSLFPSLSTHLPQFKQPYKVLLPSQRLSKFDKETHRTIAHIFVDFLCIIFYCGPGVRMCIVYTIIFISFHFIAVRSFIQDNHQANAQHVPFKIFKTHSHTL